LHGVGVLLPRGCPGLRFRAGTRGRAVPVLYILVGLSRERKGLWLEVEGSEKTVTLGG